MEADGRWQQRFSNYCRALEQLEDFFEPPALNEREEQGLIKAFEYTFELGWNTLRDLLLPWQVDLSLEAHLNTDLRAHVERVGRCLLSRASRPTPSPLPPTT